MLRRFLTIMLAISLATSLVACDDAPGEDEIGDGEINDEE
ncbi:uncharacterized lipoprotein YehR (DUF1307 family) [Bacillus mesophilus]|nr:uncharacterized lipoprotein YehR (DUF1307 family) [Bacillus mesophilus]